MLAKKCGVVLAKEWKFKNKKKFKRERERERESCELCKETILKFSLQNGLMAATAAAEEGASSFLRQINCQSSKIFSPKDSASLNFRAFVNFYAPSSVTRFGEISPLWLNCSSLWQLFEGLFSIWHNLEERLWHIYVVGQILIIVNGQRYKNNLATLFTLVLSAIGSSIASRNEGRKYFKFLKFCSL